MTGLAAISPWYQRPPPRWRGALSRDITAAPLRRSGFLETLGSPTAVSIAKVGKGYLVSQLEFGDFDVLVDDMWGDAGLEPDGYVEGIALFGPLTF